MTAQSILTELEAMGSEPIKKLLMKHGVKEPFFGVKIEDMKTIQKRVKKDYQLSKDLYATGNSDAMYLAGLIADERKMTKADLSMWVKQAQSTNICDYTVPWIAAESNHGFELALEWIDTKDEAIASAGWSTLSNLVAVKPDSELDIPALQSLLGRVERTIHESENRVRSSMNSFVIAAGSFVVSLTEYAIEVGNRIGIVTVDKGDTACKVPSAVEYINKVKNRGSLGKKKKMARC